LFFDFFERHGLCVQSTHGLGVGLSQDAAFLVSDHTAHPWVRGGEKESLLGFIQGQLHALMIKVAESRSHTKWWAVGAKWWLRLI
jgi:hypothetical protein